MGLTFSSTTSNRKAPLPYELDQDRGTLMSDTLRVLFKFENIEKLSEVHLFETHLILRPMQKNYWEV